MAYRETIQLNMLLLMYKLELKEIMFCVKSLKYFSAHLKHLQLCDLQQLLYKIWVIYEDGYIILRDKYQEHFFF